MATINKTDDTTTYLLGDQNGNNYGSQAPANAISVDPKVLERMIEIAAQQMNTTSNLQLKPSNNEINAQQTLSFPEGEYYGEVKEGQPHGQGTMTYTDPGQSLIKYEGNWKNGKYHGKGTLQYLKATFSGEWKEGKLHGFGKVTATDQSQMQCEGQYSNGQMHGKGKVTFKSGNTYEGDWKEGKKHGKGKYISANGDIYEGAFLDDKYCGKGTMKFANGDSYEGDWKDNVPNGKGTAIRVNTRMEGVWGQNKLMNGTKGEYRIVNGEAWLKEHKVNGKIVHISKCCCIVS